MKFLGKGTVFFAALVAMPVQAQQSCSVYESQINDLGSKYESDFQKIDERAQEVASRAEGITDDSAENIVNVDVDFKMKEKRIVFDLPSVTMKNRRIVFGLPKSTFKLRTFSFDVPKTRFVLKKTGEYPETRCVDTWISLPFGGKTKGVPKCTVSWSPIMTKVPEVYMERTEVKTKIPEFTWGNTEIIIKIPEFTMERQEWFVKIPEVTAVNVSNERSKIDDDVKMIEADSVKLQSEQQTEVSNITVEMYDCYIVDLESEKETALGGFDQALNELDGSIEEMKGYGLDPANLPGDEGPINLIKIRDDLQTKKREAIEEFNAAIIEMQDEKRNASETL